MRVLRTYVAQIAAAIRMSRADRTNFWLQAAGMLVNNGFYLLAWFLFFAGFKSVGGWRLPDFALMFGLICTAFGLSGVVAGGFRDMARAIVTGVPDAYLAQPKPVLARMLAHESLITAWGDAATGVLLLVVFAKLPFAALPWLAFALGCGMIVLVSTAVTFASMAFWLRGARSFARDLTDFLLMFCSYPGSIYAGTIRLLAFTVFPAGFITLVPVALLRDPSWERAAILAVAAIVYPGIALLVFHAGLARYRRGDAPSEG